MRSMNKKKVPPPEELTNAFELGYFSALIRLRREVPAAWRARTVRALTDDTLGCEETLEPGAAVTMRYSSHVGGIKLILMRCESAATMLSWRKDLSTSQKQHLQAALVKLQSETARLTAACLTPTAQ